MAPFYAVAPRMRNFQAALDSAGDRRCRDGAINEKCQACSVSAKLLSIGSLRGNFPMVEEAPVRYLSLEYVN